MARLGIVKIFIGHQHHHGNACHRLYFVDDSRVWRTTASHLPFNHTICVIRKPSLNLS